MLLWQFDQQMVNFISVMALSTGVILNPMQYRLGRVQVMVRHDGIPIPYELQVRTKDKREGEWIYLENLKYFPRKPLTSTSWRKVVLQVPKNLKKYTQICSKHSPDSSSVRASMKVVYSIQSCANLNQE